jgi:hypothetical protein
MRAVSCLATALSRSQSGYRLGLDRADGGASALTLGIEVHSAMDASHERPLERPGDFAVRRTPNNGLDALRDRFDAVARRDKHEPPRSLSDSTVLVQAASRNFRRDRGKRTHGTFYRLIATMRC